MAFKKEGGLKILHGPDNKVFKNFTFQKMRNYKIDALFNAKI